MSLIRQGDTVHTKAGWELLVLDMFVRQTPNRDFETVVKYYATRGHISAPIGEVTLSKLVEIME